MAAVAAHHQALERLGVRFFALSVDSKFVHMAWQEGELSKMIEGGVPFPLLSDGGGRIGHAYGVYDDDAAVDVRGRFLIDPDGVIQALEVLAPPVGRNVEELLRQVQAFQAVRDAGGAIACPAGWRPGGKTLAPRRTLVGRVWKEWDVHREDPAA